MKRIISLFAISAIAASTAFAQKAFKQLGVSVEAGTTGLGVNISYPLVSDHLIVSAGYNFPSFTYSEKINVGNQYVNKYIGPVSDAVKLYKKVAQDYGLTDPFSYDVEKITDLNANVDAKVNFGNFKLTLQYYPTTASNFYLTAGVFIGNGTFGTLSGDIDSRAWELYKNAITANNEIGKLPQFILSDLSNLLGTDLPVKDIEDAITFNVGDQSFRIRPEDNGHIKADLKVNKVKPYVGFGFGNAIPQQHRCGFQMEVGAYYQSKPVLVSDQEIPYDIEAIWQEDLADTKDIVQKFTWYPQITFRITGRIF